MADKVRFVYAYVHEINMGVRSVSGTRLKHNKSWENNARKLHAFMHEINRMHLQYPLRRISRANFGRLSWFSRADGRKPATSLHVVRIRRKLTLSDRAVVNTTSYFHTISPSHALTQQPVVYRAYISIRL